MSATIDEVQDWFDRMESGLDVAGCDSESEFFGDWAESLRRAEDKPAAAAEALTATIRYVDNGGNDDVVRECHTFLARLAPHLLSTPAPQGAEGEG